MTALAPAAELTREGARRIPAARRGRWLAIGLYAALAVTIGAPLLVAFLWTVVDPKAGWFAHMCCRAAGSCIIGWRTPMTPA